MISDFKDKHFGKTCIVIGNGPSLQDVPFMFLTQYPTFAQNISWLPPLSFLNYTYYVCTDPSHVDINEINKINCPKFVRHGFYIKDAHEFRLTTAKVFSKHPEVEMYEGYSVTYVSLQLAYYMGFTTVLLVGVDHKYKPYNYLKEKDPNHYHEDYHGITDWSKASLDKGAIEIPKSMQMAKEAYENDKRRIVNLNNNSNLKVFEFGAITEWMKSTY